MWPGGFLIWDITKLCYIEAVFLIGLKRGFRSSEYPMTRQFKNNLNRFLSHPVFLFFCRSVLGGMFVYASIDKILHPEQFAAILYNFHLLPNFLITIFAIVLPWFELISGVLLIAGIYPRTNAILQGLLLIVFIGALGINLIRGVDINCGCTSTDPSKTSNLLGMIIRDILLLIPVFCIVYFHKNRGKKYYNHNKGGSYEKNG